MRNILNFFWIAIILAGCSIEERPKNLITTPSGEKWLEELKSQLDKNLPNNYELLTPESNKEKQMIWLFNSEEGKKKKAVLLYKNPNEDCKVHLSIYQQVNGIWEDMEDLILAGVKVDALEIGNFTGNQKKEILIGISSEDENTKNTMHVFSVENSDLKEIYKQDYTKLFVEDLNQNGIKDISLVTYQKDQYLKVNFIEKFNKLSEISFDPNINGIAKIQLGNISKRSKGIVIDSGFGAHSGITYVANFIENQFKKIYKDDENPLTTESLVESKDVNKDGIIEFPNTFEPKGWEEQPHSNRPLFERYLQWEGNDFTPIEERYVNVENGYYIEIPKDLIGKITLENNKTKNIQRLLNTDTNETWLQIYTFNPKIDIDTKKFQKILKNTSRIIAVPNQSMYKKWTSNIKPLSEYQQD
ncbi:hypothetical protein [Bacillus cereus]|uniref:hypothetical protein n=1 Tax=Bacillus cereus TaxID=1396 RepID=UPI003A811D51